MNFKVGDSIVWCGQMDDPQSMREGTITKVRAGTSAIEGLVWVDNKHKPEDCICLAYCWPGRVKNDLMAILVERRRLKKESDDSMWLVYELRNKIVRGEV